jgi:hypothetical protein
MVVQYPLLGWPLHIGVIYFELFSIVIAFRPGLHRLWGLLLIAFHIGTILILSFSFTVNILLLALLFVMSPFHPRNQTRQQLLLQLPLFGDLHRLILGAKP